MSRTKIEKEDFNKWRNNQLNIQVFKDKIIDQFLKGKYFL